MSQHQEETERTIDSTGPFYLNPIASRPGHATFFLAGARASDSSSLLGDSTSFM